jgi:hypothetical protein
LWRQWWWCIHSIQFIRSLDCALRDWFDQQPGDVGTRFLGNGKRDVVHNSDDDLETIEAEPIRKKMVESAVAAAMTMKTSASSRL